MSYVVLKEFEYQKPTLTKDFKSMKYGRVHLLVTYLLVDFGDGWKSVIIIISLYDTYYKIRSFRYSSFVGN